LGYYNDAGNWIDLSTRIYVDNAIMLALDIDHMKMVLAAQFEAILVVMGEPNITVRQCPLAMDKLLELVIGPKQTMLGLIINTNRLTIAIPPNTYKGFLIYSTLLGTLFDIVSKCQKPKSLQKNSSSQGSQLGIPSAFPFVFVDCVCIFQEQETLD
jgi:hypothetical protein